MSKEIKFDKITIRDFGDDLFDPVKDQVTSATGKPLSPSEKKLALNNILKELGVKSWAGILLSRASVYLDQMKQARESAPKGEVEATRTALAHAKTVSQQLFLIHNQKESDELLKKALAQGAELSMKNAETLAKEGKSLAEVQAVLHTAEDYLREHRWLASGRTDDGLSERPFLDVARVNAILRPAYVKACGELPQKWALAGALAQQGKVPETAKLLEEIGSIIETANKVYGLDQVNDPKRIDDLMATALVNGVQDRFQQAGQRAKRKDSGREVVDLLQEAKNFVIEYNNKYAQRDGRAALRYDEEKSLDIIGQISGI